MSVRLNVAETAADIAWEEHAANVALLRRVYLDPAVSDDQRRRAAERTARSERRFKDAFLALDQPRPRISASGIPITRKAS